jgi:polyhydroxyalkanoate synthesis regulator phasin
MFSSPNDKIEEIKKSQNFLDELWEDQKAMQDTINTDHPNYIAGVSDEVECYAMHEQNMMRLERIKRQLDRLEEHINKRKGVQIPFG